MEMNWIPCTERMPTAYESCIVGRADVPWPITAFWTGQKWCRDVMKDEFHITHWMPMPQPPSNAEQLPKVAIKLEKRNERSIR